MSERQLAMWLNLENGMTVISPGGLDCIVHDIPECLIDEVTYQVVGEIGPDGLDLLRSMDAYTFCEWFSLKPCMKNQE